MPYHWGNCLYLEWHSVLNGRVAIEATDYVMEVEPEAIWQMPELDGILRSIGSFVEEVRVVLRDQNDVN